MISRLLEEIGFIPEWRGSESSFVLKALASVNGYSTSRTRAAPSTSWGARFVPLIARLKARTGHLVDRGAVFTPQGGLDPQS
jgi:hypothetical protein